MGSFSVRLVAALGLATTLSVPAFAAETADQYPSKTVRIMVGYTPGGGVDITARMLAEQLSHDLGKAFVIENMPGAQANIAAEYVANADPDGYTILMATSTFAINAAIEKSLKFDALKDFAPITQVNINPQLVLVHPSVPAKNMAELIKYGKDNPGEIDIAYTGLLQEFLGQEFGRQAGIEIVGVPYSGASAALTALLSNEVDVYFGSTTSSGQYVRSGQLNAFALTAKERSKALPEVPTVAEVGLPDYQMSTWYSLLAPAGTPPDIVAKIQKSVKAALDSPKMQQNLESNGAIAIGSTPEEFTETLHTEIARFKAAFPEGK